MMNANTTATANAGTRWTAQDMRDLADLRAMGATNNEIAYVMGRTIDAIETTKRDHALREHTSRNVKTRGTARTSTTPTIVTYGRVCPSCYVVTPVGTNRCETCD